MRPADAPGDTPDDRSSEAWLRGLAENARIMADSVIVTDLDRLVVVWNDAAAALYGIDPALALGAPIETLFDSEIIGAESDPPGVRHLALERGSWRGRVTDRPLVGDRVGDEIVIDVMLSRLADGLGKPIGVLSVKRDVTAGVRLEREVASLGSLASATGEARSRSTLAERALEVVAAATGADHAVIVIAKAGAGQVLASKGRLPGIELIVDVPWADAPAIRAVTPVGRVVKGPVDRLPFLPASRRLIVEGGVRWLLVVGLHREEELIGVLSLGWNDRVPLPSDSVTLLAATTIARGLENARLVEEIVRRGDEQRATAIRLRKLDGLTRLGGRVETIDELATASCRLIIDALDAVGAAYGLLAADGDRYETSVFVDVPEPFERWLRDRGPRGPSAFARWRLGEDPFVAPLADGSVPDDLAAIARDVGLATFAVIPIRVDGVITGRIAVYFARQVDEVHLEATTMEQVGTIVSIALQNFRLGDRLVRSERRYRTMFEASPDPMVVVTPDGEVVDANHAATRLFGAPREWLIGRQPGELVEVDPRFPPMAVTLPVGASFVSDAIGIRRDGTRFPQESAVAAVELDGERRLIIRMHDLTDQERLQSELVQAQKMDAIGRLVSGVAHELNNPLAAILGFSQLIRRDDGLPESLRHNADLLIQEAARTRGIVQNLLDFARQRPPERHPTSIARLVDSVLALQSYSLDRGPIELEVDVPEDLPLVELDRGQAQQVLINLLNNAAYAVEHGGGTRIGIRAARVGRDADGAVRITVLDDGPGVPTANLGRLFEPFFTTKPPTDGTGLGLSVSAGIVQAHGGDLRYAPSGWGTGAAFTFDLPARSSRAPGAGNAWSPVSVLDGDATPTISASLDGRSDGPRVLVIDDEPSILVFLAHALRSLGYRPVVTEMGEEAVELVANGTFDAIVCDHRMEGLSGIDLWQAVVAARPDMADRWIMMSGDILNPSLDAFVAVNNVTVLAKPFDLGTLDRALRYRLEAAGPSRG